MTLQLSMYEASVPVFLRYLNQLDKMLDLAQEFAIATGREPQSILQARLAPTMLPFAVQVEIATNFATRACLPLAGMEVPKFDEHRGSFADLKAHIAQTAQVLAKLTRAQMEGGEHRIIKDKAGEAVLALPGSIFLLQYALPNFIFHLTTAYAILRHIGVDIGKSDFDGFHAY